MKTGGGALVIRVSSPFPLMAWRVFSYAIVTLSRPSCMLLYIIESALFGSFSGESSSTGHAPPMEVVAESCSPSLSIQELRTTWRSFSVIESISGLAFGKKPANSSPPAFDAVVVSYGGGERLCDRPQQLVADVVSLGVVSLNRLKWSMSKKSSPNGVRLTSHKRKRRSGSGLWKLLQLFLKRTAAWYSNIVRSASPGTT